MAKSQSSDALMKEYRTLAKRADQRMVRLEQYSKRPEYKGILRFAYARAQHDLKAYASEKRLATGMPLRFNTAPPKTKSGEINTKALQGKINLIKRFLTSQASTIDKPKKQMAGETGLNQTYKKRVDTINKTYGTDFTWQELAQFFDSGLADKMQKFGSDVRLKVIAVVQANKKAIIDALQSEGNKTLVIEKNPFTTDPSKPLDPFLQKKLDEMLHDADKDLERFLKGKKKPGPKKKKKPAKKKTVKKSKKGKK